jgi:hypothetical protein
MGKIEAFFKGWTGGIVIGIAAALAVENRTGGGGGQLTTLVDKIPLLGGLITGHKSK